MARGEQLETSSVRVRDAAVSLAGERAWALFFSCQGIEQGSLTFRTLLFQSTPENSNPYYLEGGSTEVATAK